MTGHPFLTAIGDWVVVALKKNGKPACFGEKADRMEVCEVTGITEQEFGGLEIHLVGENEERFKVGYYNVNNMEICDETLQAFGFETCDGDRNADGWLYEEHRWRLDCHELNVPDLGYFYLSWQDDEDMCRSYRVICRGYGEDMSLLEDTIAELQHWFFRYNSEFPMPLRYRGRAHFKPVRIPTKEESERQTTETACNILKAMLTGDKDISGSSEP